MRRSRSALTAWPAFADLMTVLAVLGLAIAAGVAIGSEAELAAVIDRVEDRQAELAAAREHNARDTDRIQALETQLAAAREHNQALEARLAVARERGPRGGGRTQALEAELAAAQARIAALETRIRLGSVPCLGTRPGSRTAPVPLLRIVVDSGYRLSRLWPPEKEASVARIPRLEEAIARGLMQEGDLSRYARGMHAYGNSDDTYGGSCRFWVELRKGEIASQTAFARALGMVNQYFLLTNSSEVNRILRAAE